MIDFVQTLWMLDATWKGVSSEFKDVKAIWGQCTGLSLKRKDSDNILLIFYSVLNDMSFKIASVSCVKKRKPKSSNKHKRNMAGLFGGKRSSLNVKGIGSKIYSSPWTENFSQSWVLLIRIIWQHSFDKHNEGVQSYHLTFPWRTHNFDKYCVRISVHPT